MDDERLKNLGGGNYWKELLDRIRDIRSSEKVMYRQFLDLYATSVDYNPNSSESIAFFKMVQNKLHYAAHGHTAAEVIYERADASKPFMGLTAFSGDFPTAKDTQSFRFGDRKRDHRGYLLIWVYKKSCFVMFSVSNSVNKWTICSV